MKKMLFVVMASVLVMGLFSMTGCGNKAATTVDESKPATESKVPADTTASKDKGKIAGQTEVVPPAPGDKESPKPVQTQKDKASPVQKQKAQPAQSQKEKPAPTQEKPSQEQPTQKSSIDI